MSRPQFTDDEEYLIRAGLAPTVYAQSNAFMWGYVLSGVALAGFATYSQSFPLLLSAFAVVCGFRLYEERYHAKWAPLWRSILGKYEAALRETDQSTASGANALPVRDAHVPPTS